MNLMKPESIKWRVATVFWSCCLMAAMTGFSGPLFAAEIYSNGVGGGAWSDPSTWRGGKVPAAEDTAVISSHDSINFDADGEAVTCASLSIDPEGVLHIKGAPGGGSRIMTVAGSIDLFGTIRMDAANSPGSNVELRLAGRDKAGRTVRIGKRGGLLTFGAEGVDYDDLNVRIRNVSAQEEGDGRDASIVAGDGAILDLRFASFHNVKISGTRLDNTGYEAGEGFNVVGCSFTGLSSVSAVYCDTPRIADCRFHIETNDRPPFGISVTRCSLPEISGNHVSGRFNHGIQIIHSTDATAINNFVTRSKYGFYWVGPNGMAHGNRTHTCNIAFYGSEMTGLIQEQEVKQCFRAIQMLRSDVQVRDLKWREPTGDPQPINMNASAGIFVNLPFGADALVAGSMEPKAANKPVAIAMYYLIVNVNGKRRPGMNVSVRTEGLADGKPDPNVRNGAAPVLSNGLTPLPQSMEPILVRAWEFDRKGKASPAPSYVVTLWEPTGDAKSPRRTLATTTVTPDKTWYREQPNATVGTIEMTIP